MGQIPWKDVLFILVTLAVSARIDYLRGLIFQPGAKQ